jgi:6-phospho-3-hexuloisomerase
MNNIIEELSSISNQFDYSQLEIVTDLFDRSDSKKFVGFAAGRMGFSLKAFMMRLNHLGYESYMIGDTNFPRLDTSSIVFISSSSGETETNIVYAKQAVQCGAKTVLFTSNANSTLANICEVVILYPTIDSNQLMKTAYEQFTFILFDFICSQIVKKKNLDFSFIENNHSISE